MIVEEKMGSSEGRRRKPGSTCIGKEDGQQLGVLGAGRRGKGKKKSGEQNRGTGRERERSWERGG